MRRLSLNPATFGIFLGLFGTWILAAILLNQSEGNEAAALLLAYPLMRFSHTALHEAAHALVALAVGYRIQEVVIGDQPPQCWLRIGRVPIIFGPNLFWAGGYVQISHPSSGWYRLRNILVSIAGPVLDLGLLLTCIYLIYEGLVPARSAEGVSTIALLMSAGLTIWWGLPRDREGPHDLESVGQMLRASSSQLEEWQRHSAYDFAWSQEDWQKIHAFLKDGAEDREDPGFRPAWAHVIWRIDSAEAALRLADQWLATDPSPENMLLVAFYGMIQDDPTIREQAGQLAQELFEHEERPYMDLRMAILGAMTALESGQLEDARQALRWGLDHCLHPGDQEAILLHLSGILAQACDRPQLATRQFRRARKSRADCPIHEWRPLRAAPATSN